MRSRFISFLTFLVLIIPGGLFAQGRYQGLGFPKTVTATGQTETIGSIMVSLQLGPTDAGTLVIDVSPLRITNTNAATIRVTATGIGVGGTTIDTDNNLVRIPVLAGATAGSIRIDGIRVAIAGTTITSL